MNSDAPLHRFGKRILNIRSSAVWLMAVFRQRSLKFYLIQDYLFLLDYSRVFAYGVIKAHDEATMAMFSQLVNETLNTEMDLHRGYCEKFGITAAEMEAAPMAPTTHAYTRHLLNVAETGTLVDLVAGVLPCQWGYAEIGTNTC